MARAICIHCGEQKTEAFAQCPKCEFDPVAKDVDRLTQAKSLYLSEHHLNAKELDKLSAQIKAGKPVPFDERRVDELLKQLQTQQNFILRPQRSMGCALFVAVFVVLLAVGFWVTLRYFS